MGTGWSCTWQIYNKPIAGSHCCLKRGFWRWHLPWEGVLLVGLAPTPHRSKAEALWGSGAFRDLLCLLVGTLCAPACIFPQTGASDSVSSPSLPTPSLPWRGLCSLLPTLMLCWGSAAGFSWILLGKVSLNHRSSIFSLSTSGAPK